MIRLIYFKQYERTFIYKPDSLDLEFGSAKLYLVITNVKFQHSLIFWAYFIYVINPVFIRRQ